MRAGKSAEYRAALRDVIYETLNEVVGVPDDDRHEVVTEHDEDGLFIAPTFLGVERSPDALLIQITFNEGRDVEQKKALYAELVRRLHERVGLDPADVTINLLEVKPENWSFGHGRAQYVAGD
jgi:phenylpyruvate tautomerase PptA (4-oxalocrotonate tautomerase family)